MNRYAKIVLQQKIVLSYMHPFAFSATRIPVMCVIWTTHGHTGHVSSLVQYTVDGRTCRSWIFIQCLDRFSRLDSALELCVCVPNSTYMFLASEIATMLVVVHSRVGYTKC